jgi:exopolysaccharide biosynthesis protein
MHRRVAHLLVAAAFAIACQRADPSAWLGAPKNIAPGVDFYQVTDPTLVDPQGPIAVYLLRLDLDRVQIESGLSNDEVMMAERVDEIAQRHKAIAAINAGFFNVKNGEPAGLLKVAGELVSDTGLTRGVVAIHSEAGARQQLFFDQASARVQAQFTANNKSFIVPIDGVDTTRERGKLMLYTPAYHADTDTAPKGTEWVLSGNPLKVVAMRTDAGKTPIPRDGVVLSYGGLDLPPTLDWLLPDVEVTFKTTWKILNGTSEARFENAREIVNGAGLLIRDGAPMSGWQGAENLVPGTFTDVRHPRTLIGLDRKGALWLAAIDGRQPDHSVGMTFAELQGLCRRLEFQHALNLDGGGSTTMVIGSEIVNRPSDATGPRPVSDAILVKARAGASQK